MVNIRTIDRDDKEKLIQFVISMIGDSNPKEIAAGVVKDFYEKKDMHTFIIEKENKSIGFSVLKVDPFEGARNVAEIVWLNIEENHQRKGYGDKVVNYVEKHALEKGIRKLYVKTSSENKKAVCFWIKQDYKFESRLLDFSFEGHDDYYLTKKL